MSLSVVENSSALALRASRRSRFRLVLAISLLVQLPVASRSRAVNADYRKGRTVSVRPAAGASGGDLSPLDGQRIGPQRAMIDPWKRSSARRSEEHTSELQSLMRNSYAVFCLKKKKRTDSNQPSANKIKQKITPN